MPVRYMHKISYIEADGIQLVNILSTFEYVNYKGNSYTIPTIRNAHKMRWYGDIAKTILLNLSIYE